MIIQSALHLIDDIRSSLNLFSLTNSFKFLEVEEISLIFTLISFDPLIF